MRAPPEIFVIAMSLAGVLVAIFSILVLKRIRENPEVVEARLKLKPEGTLSDFKQLFLANTLLAFFFAAYTITGYLGNDLGIIATEILLAVPVIIVAKVFLDIWRRIK